MSKSSLIGISSIDGAILLLYYGDNMISFDFIIFKNIRAYDDAFCIQENNYLNISNCNFTEFSKI